MYKIPLVDVVLVKTKAADYVSGFLLSRCAIMAGSEISTYQDATLYYSHYAQKT